MRRREHTRAFTLAELMVAVAVLIVVIVATSKIFGIASRVAGLGEATADVIQESSTIERQLREDFKRLSDDGFFLIRCVRVRNDVNLQSGGPLLDPALPLDAYLRTDQLFFFVDGAQHMATLGTRGTNIRGLGIASRVYWGHGIQLSLREADGDQSNEVRVHDPVLNYANPLLPWHRGPYATQWTRYLHYGVDPNSSNADYTVESPAGSPDATQPSASNWLLVRHAVVMADDDDGQPERFMYGNRTAFRIDHAPVFQGRVDGAAQQLSDIRRLVTLAPAQYTCNGEDVIARPWFDTNYGPGDQRSVIAALCGRGEVLYGTGNFGQVVQADRPVYTRAERIAPGMLRVDQALTNHVIGTAVSSFRIDWTWAPRTGELRDPDGNIMIAPGPDLIDDGGGGDDIWLTGLLVDDDRLNTPAYREQPWFGMEEPQRGVYFYGTDVQPWWYWAETVDANNVEEVVYPPTGNFGPDEPLVVYEAAFGYNRGVALNADGNPDPVINITGDPDCTRTGYTPWPSAVRITLTLHDQRQRFSEGREIQFVVDLPRRN
jgi:type II secretory pathway pseudopilin PulG